MAEQISNMDKRIAVMEAQFPILINTLEKSLDEMKQELRDFTRTLSIHYQESAIQKEALASLTKTVGDVQSIIEDHKKSDDEFHAKVRNYMVGVAIVMAILSGIAKFVIPPLLEKLF